MNDLSETREKIDGIDTELAALLTRRMACSREIAEKKKDSGSPVSDRRREREVLAHVSRHCAPEYVGYVQSVY